jgi:hypothetical protein
MCDVIAIACVMCACDSVCCVVLFIHNVLCLSYTMVCRAPQNGGYVAPIPSRRRPQFGGGFNLKFLKLTKSPLDLSKLPREKRLFF